MGSCPRCGGSLKFADEGPESTLEQIETADAVALAPHLVMGIPRR